jgi:hypothetical protein
MTNEALKAWLEAMPIEEVQHKIERLEAKLADLRVLERLYTGRHQPPAPPEASPEGGGQPPPQPWGEPQG